jgi:hypothetical protein
MLKLPTHSGFHDLFLKSQIHTFDDFLSTLNPKFSDWSLLIPQICFIAVKKKIGKERSTGMPMIC